jgi:hypothetical protein
MQHTQNWNEVTEFFSPGILKVWDPSVPAKRVLARHRTSNHAVGETPVQDPKHWPTGWGKRQGRRSQCHFSYKLQLIWFAGEQVVFGGKAEMEEGWDVHWREGCCLWNPGEGGQYVVEKAQGLLFGPLQFSRSFPRRRQQAGANGKLSVLAVREAMKAWVPSGMLVPERQVRLLWDGRRSGQTYLAGEIACPGMWFS